MCPKRSKLWERNAEKTKEMFDKDGFLKTGDVGFRDKEGNFFIVDRMKDLIISSGYKIWPKEVEDIIHEFPGVKEVAVIGFEFCTLLFYSRLGKQKRTKT